MLISIEWVLNYSGLLLPHLALYDLAITSYLNIYKTDMILHISSYLPSPLGGMLYQLSVSV